MDRKSQTPSPGAQPSNDDTELRELHAWAVVNVQLPTDAQVVGESVRVTHLRYQGPRVGLVATCQRAGREFDLALADVVFPPDSAGAELGARYRSWLGLGPTQADPPGLQMLGGPEIRTGEPLELIVLACKSNALRCRLPGSAREITLRTAVRDEVPGSLITVTPVKQWTHARHPYLSGSVDSVRLDASALDLEPLALQGEGDWDPGEDYWREKGERLAAWEKRILARGKRPRFEMEQIIPGADPDDFDTDPILEASERNAAGDRAGARDGLMKLLAADLRCLDAHAHLGNFAFDHWPVLAQRHYEMGVAIGALSLGKGFEGVLSWGLVDNRPFLRCLHGAGLCAWRLGDLGRARAVFEQMLWLNPGDHQGARFNLAGIAAGKTWDALEEAAR